MAPELFAYLTSVFSLVFGPAASLPGRAPEPLSEFSCEDGRERGSPSVRLGWGKSGAAVEPGELTPFP